MSAATFKIKVLPKRMAKSGALFSPWWGQISPPVDTGNQMSDLLNHSRRNTTMCWDDRMMNPEAIIRSPTCAKILPKMFCPDC